MQSESEDTEMRPVIDDETEPDVEVDIPKRSHWQTSCLHLRCFVIIMFIVSLEIGSINQTMYVYHRIQNTYMDQYFVSKTTVNHSLTALCGKNTSTNSEIKSQQEATRWSWYFSIVQNGIAIIPLLVYGMFSDYLGRKPLLIISISGVLIRYVVSAVIVHQELSLPYFFIAYAAEGICGCHYSFFLATMASIADKTQRDNTRSIGLTILEGLLGIGASTGHLIAGYLIKYCGYFYTNIVAIGMLLFNLITVLMFIPDTLRRQSILGLSLKSATRRLFGFYYDKTMVIYAEAWKFKCIVAAFIIMYFARVSKGHIETLYQMRSPFCWTSVTIGWYGFVVDIAQYVAGMCVVPLLHMCTNDEVISIIGCVSNVSFTLIEGLASSSWMLYIAAASGVLSIIQFPTLRSICSRMVSPDLQGALFANLYVLENFFSLLSKSISNNVYEYTQSVMPGLTFLTLPALFLISIGIILSVMFCKRKPNDEHISVRRRHLSETYNEHI